MKRKLQQVLVEVLKDMGVSDIVPLVEHTADLGYGDYTTNVAMMLAKQLKRSPVDIAKEIKDKLTAHSSQLTAKAKHHSTDQNGQIVSDLGRVSNVLQDIDRIEVALPGFINFTISASTLSTTLTEVLETKEAFGRRQPTANSLQPTVNYKKAVSYKKIMVEFAHPNTHKAFHIGHLRNITTGESIVRLLESQGHEVIRANYQGDVGMHIAKALFALLQISNIKYQISNIKNARERVEFLGKAYAAGSKAFEDDPQAQQTIKDYNFLIYAAAQKFQQEKGIIPSSTDYLKFISGREVELDQVYVVWKETRQWSLDYFDSIYKRVGSHFDRFYFESECLKGVDIAKGAIKKGILEESEGAIIFNGKKFDLDTRVFVNSLGLPTYEAKELALAQKEFSEFGKLDKVIHVVGPEQASFFQVTFKAEELLGIQKNQQYHLVYGWVKLKQGKMSSRLGNVVLGESLLEEAKKAVRDILDNSSFWQAAAGPESVTSSDSGQARVTDEIISEKDEVAEKAAVAAVKYSFLKVATLNQIAFDISESVNINGDSGPYIQYTYARCKSVLRKAGGLSFQAEGEKSPRGSLTAFEMTKHVPEELFVMRLIYRFTEVVQMAADLYSPNMVCEYLYDLASAYNRFYNKHSILGKAQEIPKLKSQIPKKPTTHDSQPTTSQRLALTAATAQVLKNGLYLLGIETLEKM